MSVFRYEALDPTGQTHKGNIEADTARAARHQLRLQGLTPITLDAVTHRTHKHSNTFSHLARELRPTEVTRLIRELASLLQANLALATALQALFEQAEHPRVREKISSIRAEVMAGQPLHQALNLHPKSFPELVIATVAAGEQTGHLGNVLEKLADALEARHTLNQKVIAAFIYPAIVTLVALLVVTGLLTYVVPQVVSVFENTHQQLPTLTVIMIGLSNTLRQWGWLIGLLIGCSIALFRKALHIPQFRLWTDTHLLRIPLAGPFIRAINTARLASTLAILVNSGVPILKALTAANRTLTNQALQQAMNQVHEHVKEGGSLSKALSKSGLFPPVLAHLVASGESTGQLPAMLERASHTQRAEVERKALWLTSLLEPLLILVMGLIVLLIVLAVMMPIIEVNQLVR